MPAATEKAIMKAASKYLFPYFLRILGQFLKTPCIGQVQRNTHSISKVLSFSYPYLLPMQMMSRTIICHNQAGFHDVMNLYNQPAFSNMKAYVSMHFAAQNVLHRSVIDLILCFKRTKKNLLL